VVANNLYVGSVVLLIESKLQTEVERVANITTFATKKLAAAAIYCIYCILVLFVRHLVMLVSF